MNPLIGTTIQHNGETLYAANVRDLDRGCVHCVLNYDAACTSTPCYGVVWVKVEDFALIRMGLEPAVYRDARNSPPTDTPTEIE